MTGRLTPSMLATMRARVANGKPVKDDADTPHQWERAETVRVIQIVSQQVTIFLEMEQQTEEDPDVEINSRRLSLLVGRDPNNIKKSAKYDITFLFGPARAGRRDVRERVYVWREVRKKAHRLMVSKVIQRLGASLEKELS